MTDGAVDAGSLDPPRGFQPVGVLYRLDLTPYFANPPNALCANYRSAHWAGRSTASREVREAVSTLARVVGLHRVAGARHVTVELVWAPGDRRRRDAGNLSPMLKAAVDGLTPARTVTRRTKGKLKISHHVGVGVIPDDTPQWVTELAPRIIGPPLRGMWLSVWVET
jgi:hypothetical protein